MKNGEEIAKALCGTIVEIAKREKEKALKKEDYCEVLIAGFFEGLFTEAEKSFHK